MGSRSVASTHAGSYCPDSAQIGKVHGPAAATGSVTFSGSASISLGSTIGIIIDNASFIGFAIKSDKNDSVESGTSTSVIAVDWRDRLSDNWFFAAYNVQEEDGRYWHLLHEDWEDQKKIWLSKELDTFSFSKVQSHKSDVNLLRRKLREELISTATIMNILSKKFNFDWVAESFILKIMKETYPLNMDWTGGVRASDAIESILSFSGLQWTAIGTRKIHITLRGWVSNSFVSGFLSGFVNICSIGAVDGSAGNEISEKGRRATVVGGINKHQFIYPCRIGWNPKFTWELCFSGWGLSALLEKHGLTPLSKLGELPEEYHDTNTWFDDKDNEAFSGRRNSIRSRNEMTIKDYVSKVCFHQYTVDARYIASGKIGKLKEDTFDSKVRPVDRDDLTVDESEDETEISDFDVLEDWKLEWKEETLNFKWPLSNRLVNESNAQFLVFATTRSITDGTLSPFTKQLTATPMNEGVSIFSEEVINPTTAHSEYRVHLTFTDPQFFLDTSKEFTDPASVEPDKILVALSTDKGIYHYTTGETADGPKVRTAKRTIKNLHKGFINGKEVTILAENFVKNMKDGSAQPTVSPVKADDIAKRITQQMLFHEATHKSGNLRFEGMAGTEVDGVIDTVSSAFDAVSGVTETVNFTSGWLSDDSFPTVLALGVSTAVKTEEDIALDRLLSLASSSSREKTATTKTLPKSGDILHSPGGGLDPASLKTAFGGGTARRGSVEVEIKQAVMDNTIEEDMLPGHIMIIGDDKEDE